MFPGRRSALLALAVMLALLAGCGKKRIATNPTVIAAVPAPTPSPTPPPTPAPGPPPPVNVEPPYVPPEPAKPLPEPQVPAVARRTAPPPQPAPAPEESQHVAVPPGPALPVPGQLSAALSRDDMLERRSTTAQLLEGAELNLKNLNRSLSNDEKAVLQHIRSYIKQSRAASDTGDVDRAYNLALKAHLLSEELVKR
jgi:outer membrane biosynthesis protein TonB